MAVVMDARTCAQCGESKPISGIWYLLADGAGLFVCSACFTEAGTEPGSAASP